MFIGHFAIGYGAKKLNPKMNLGFLFLACQFLDLIWPILVLLNIEKVSVEFNATVVTPLNFEYYPYSHSLLMTLLFSMLFASLVWIKFKSYKSSLLIGMVVFSHWVLDFITHRKDLPIGFGELKLGLGLWNFKYLTVIIEVLMFVFGLGLYLNSHSRLSKVKKIWFWLLVAFLMLIYVGNIFGPKPPLNIQSSMIASPGLAMWLLVLWAYLIDRK